ncbi:putative uncharacterized protein [Waddlia chondrophila 2032/99]|uniref:Uncharacterized protein n=1 Tax=Waddlia chondrophila 2032/99 TaxID=765953 RepID=F8LEZ8_9BACT|nr:putative uncharacterized protein [Waddlia chondrophila 2032/99]
MSSAPIGGEGTGGIIPVNSESEQTPQTQEIDPQVFIDQIEQMIESDDNIRLLAKGQIGLPPGRISIAELTALINAVILKLKKEIQAAEQLDALISERFHRSIAQTAESLEGLHGELNDIVVSWRNFTNENGETVHDAYDNLQQATDEYNQMMQNLWGEDRAAIQEYNQIIHQYNNLDSDGVDDIYDSLSQAERDALIAGLTQSEIDAYGGTKEAVVAKYFDKKIDEFNQYAASRPNVQAAINNLQQATADYNNVVDDYNLHIDQVNAERAEYGLGPLPYMVKTPTPNPNVAFTNLSQQPHVQAPLLPTPNRQLLTVPNASQKGTVSEPTYPGDPPSVPSYEMMILHFIPIALTTFDYLASFNRALDLADAYVQWNRYALLTGAQLTLPYGVLNQINNVFLQSVNAIGGVGLAAHAIGLHSRSLEIILSRALFQSLAQQLSLPISARLFSRLQFTALELLSRSALLSAYPSMRFLASRFGFLAASSPSVQAAIALAFAGQIGSLVSSGIVRGIINGQINRLGFYARHNVRFSAAEVEYAERNLANAIASGNPFLIASAVRRLTSAQVRLANAVRLSRTFGSLSIGGYAAFTNRVAAALNISLLGVSTSLFARTLGLPGLVAQIFAHVTHLSPIDILIASTAGSSIRAVLDNPLSVLFIKQNLANQLVYRLGFSSSYAAAIVNNAINNAVFASVGLHTYSRLHNELYLQFRAEGLSPYHANRLANETTSLIRGDLGVQFLNVVFGIHADTSLIASTVVNSIYGFDKGIAGVMLSNAIVRSLQYGGYGSRVRLQNELTEVFQSMGRRDGSELAAQYVRFIETVGSLVPLTRYPGLASVLLGNGLLRNLALGGAFVRNEIRNDLIMRGLSPTQAAFVADQLIALSTGNFVRPSDQLLFELTLNAAIERALIHSGSFETHREFRDQLINELRSVGFRLNDALFLANSIAAFAANGEALSLLGLSAGQINGLNISLVNELTVSGISGSQAQTIVDRAYANTTAKAPFFSPDDFQNTLKEEIFRQTFLASGRLDGHEIFDKAAAHAQDPSTILDLASLIEQISGAAQGVFRPDLGSELAQEVHNALLNALLGGTTIDEISNEETRNPLSVLNQLNDQIDKLTKDEEIANLIKLLKKLQELLAALLTGSPEGHLLGTSIMDAASGPFFGAANVSQGGQDYQAMQIPV